MTILSMSRSFSILIPGLILAIQGPNAHGAGDVGDDDRDSHSEYECPLRTDETRKALENFFLYEKFDQLRADLDMPGLERRSDLKALRNPEDASICARFNEMFSDTIGATAYSPDRDIEYYRYDVVYYRSDDFYFVVTYPRPAPQPDDPGYISSSTGFGSLGIYNSNLEKVGGTLL